MDVDDGADDGTDGHKTTTASTGRIRRDRRREDGRTARCRRRRWDGRKIIYVYIYILFDLFHVDVLVMCQWYIGDMFVMFGRCLGDVWMMFR